MILQVFLDRDPHLPVNIDVLYGDHNSSSLIISPLWRDDSINPGRKFKGGKTGDFEESASDLRARRVTFICRILREMPNAYKPSNTIRRTTHCLSIWI